MKKWIFSMAMVCGLSACVRTTDIEQGGGSEINGGVSLVETIEAGRFVRNLLDNTSFFKALPLGEAQADMLLQKHTSMKVIQTSPSYTRVELDSGEVGYVQTAMLEPIPSEAPPLHGIGDPPPNHPTVPTIPPSMPPSIPPILDPGSAPLPPGA